MIDIDTRLESPSIKNITIIKYTNRLKSYCEKQVLIIMIQSHQSVLDVVKKNLKNISYAIK